MALTTTEMLQGQTVVGGGVAVTASARVRSSPWVDAPEDGGSDVVLRVEAVRRSVMRTEAKPTAGVPCWVQDASVMYMMSVSLGTGRQAIAVG